MWLDHHHHIEYNDEEKDTDLETKDDEGDTDLDTEPGNDQVDLDEEDSIHNLGFVNLPTTKSKKRKLRHNLSDAVRENRQNGCW